MDKMYALNCLVTATEALSMQREGGSTGPPSRSLYNSLEHFTYLSEHNLENDDLAVDIAVNIFPSRFKCFDTDFSNPNNMNIGIYLIKQKDDPIRFTLVNVNTMTEYVITCIKEGDQLLFEKKILRDALPVLSKVNPPMK